MSVRTKVLVTVATVATMTAIGTTKAYGLENKSVNNVEKVQISMEQSDDGVSKTKDLNINENVKSEIDNKKESISKDGTEEKVLSKINQEKKQETSEKVVEQKNLNNKKYVNNLKLKETQENGIKEDVKSKLVEDKTNKSEKTSKKEEIKQDAGKNLKVTLDKDKSTVSKEQEESNIVEGKIVNTISKVNIRKNASSDSIVIGELSLGENIKVDKNNSNSEWYGVCFGEHGGFVSVKYIDINERVKTDKSFTQVKELDKEPVFNSAVDKNQSNIIKGQVIGILSKLNVRESASLDSVIIGQLSSTEEVKVDKNHSNSEWYGICFGEHGGFVSTKYIKLDEAIIDNKTEDKDKHDDKKDDHKEVSKDDTGKKEEKHEESKDKETSNFVLGEVINIASYLNVREKPTTKSETIGKIYEGNQVLINKAKSIDGWYEIAFGNNGGYVSSDYIKVIKKDYLITDGLVKFVASYEGYSATAYRGADYQNRTIGYGHVIMPGETYSYLTEPEARNLLKSDLNVTATQVKAVLDKKDIKLNTHQFDSLVSFAYNCGVQGLANSRLLKDIQNKADLAEIKDAFLAWRHCNGIELEGLRRRRVEEFEMYSTGDYIRDLN